MTTPTVRKPFLFKTHCIGFKMIDIYKDKDYAAMAKMKIQDLKNFIGTGQPVAYKASNFHLNEHLLESKPGLENDVIREDLIVLQVEPVFDGALNELGYLPLATEEQVIAVWNALAPRGDTRIGLETRFGYSDISPEAKKKLKPIHGAKDLGDIREKVKSNPTMST